MRLLVSKQAVCSLALVVTVALLLVMSGCVTNGGEVVESLDAATVAKMLPDNNDFMIYVDVQQFRNDDEMSEIYDGWSCLYKIIQRPIYYFQWSGVPFSEVAWGAQAWGLREESSEGTGGLIIGGSFDHSDIHKELAASGWEQDEYKGYEVWRYYYLDVSSIAIAFTDDYYITGMAADCIDVISGNRSSLYDIPVVTEFFSRLSPGCFVGMSYGRSFQTKYNWGQLIEGASLAMNNDRSMSAHGVLIFQDGNDALNALGEIEDAVVDGWGWPLDTSEINVTIDGNVVDVRCEIDLEDVKELAYRPELQAQCK